MWDRIHWGWVAPTTAPRSSRIEGDSTTSSLRFGSLSGAPQRKIIVNRVADAIQLQRLLHTIEQQVRVHPGSIQNLSLEFTARDHKRGPEQLQFWVNGRRVQFTRPIPQAHQPIEPLSGDVFHNSGSGPSHTLSWDGAGNKVASLAIQTPDSAHSAYLRLVAALGPQFLAHYQVSFFAPSGFPNPRALLSELFQRSKPDSPMSLTWRRQPPIPTPSGEPLIRLSATPKDNRLQTVTLQKETTQHPGLVTVSYRAEPDGPFTHSLTVPTLGAAADQKDTLRRLFRVINA